MGSLWRRVGRYEILRLVDGVYATTTDAMVHARGRTALERAIANWGSGSIEIDVNCFALRGAEGVMLIDAGTGTAWGPALGHARAAMEAAGIAPEAVDRVLLTHIHGDHALGLLDGPDPYFPKAEILVPDADLAFFTDPEARAATPEARRGGFDIAATLLDAYAGRVRPIPAGPVLEQIEAVALPGHTPGHVGYLIGQQTGAMMLWGDALHLGEAQARDPDLGLHFDLDQARATATRRALLARAAASGWIVGGGHIRGFGLVRGADGHTVMEPA